MLEDLPQECGRAGVGLVFPPPALVPEWRWIETLIAFGHGYWVQDGFVREMREKIKASLASSSSFHDPTSGLK